MEYNYEFQAGQKELIADVLQTINETKQKVEQEKEQESGQVRDALSALTVITTLAALAVMAKQNMGSLISDIRIP